MPNPMKSFMSAGAIAVAATLLAACGGGSSDVAGGGDQPKADTTLTLVAYAVPEPGWSKIIPAFAATPEGKGVAVTTSYGASGDQSRGVVDGKPADIVNFSVEPDVTRLVKADKVAKDWNTDATKGIPFGSVVTLVVRKGNPKNIKRLGRSAAARPRGGHPQPAELRLGQVEPVGAVRRREQRWQEPAGRPRLRQQAGHRARQDAARVRAGRPPTCSCRAAVTC